MKDFFAHTRTYIFRGLIAIIPILLCFFALQLLYVLIDKKVMTFIDQFIDIRQIPGLGLLLVLITLYLIGLIVSNVMGRQILLFIEHLSKQIPFVKAIYSVGKQISESLSSTSDKQAFKKALLMETNPGGGWTVVFVTGSLKDETTGEELLKVFVPTVPNPATGFIVIVKASITIDPGWSVEEALKMVVSAGIISPETLKKI